MLTVRSNRPETKAYDGLFVMPRTDYCVVESEDGKLLIVTPGELYDGPIERLRVKSTRPHIKVHNGQEVRVVRAIKSGDSGYSEDVGQVVVQPKDGAQFTVQNDELVSDFEECDGVIHSNRPELKDHKGESVRVLRSVRPGDDNYNIGGPHQYWVVGKDKKEFAVEAGELKMSKAPPKPAPAKPEPAKPASTGFFGFGKKKS
jgi:hypothetical protein